MFCQERIKVSKRLKAEYVHKREKVLAYRLIVFLVQSRNDMSDLVLNNNLSENDKSGLVLNNNLSKRDRIVFTKQIPDYNYKFKSQPP